MLEEWTSKIKEEIQRDMKEKFGLTDDQSRQSSKILQERIRELFSEQNLKGNLDQVKSFLKDLGNDSSSLKDRFNKETVDELINKVGLSEDVASRIKDFSLEEYMKQIKSSFTEFEGLLDLDSIKEKLTRENLEDNAKDVLNNISKLFNKGS